MNWIPAVVLVMGFINCEQEPPQPQPVAPVDAGVAAKADTAPAAAVPIDVEPESALFLWEVTREGNHRTSWLYGTINDPRAPVDFSVAPEVVKLALTQTSHSMFEIPSGSAAHRDRTKLMAMKSGSLRREVGAARFKKITQITRDPTNVLDVMNPWVIFLALEEKLSADPPMDEAWAGFAQSHRHRISHLESVQEQVDVLVKVVDFETIRNLTDEHEKYQEQSEAIAAAYHAGSIEDLNAAVFPEDNARARLYEKLVESRVPRWTAKMEAQFSNDPTLVVVNARYLIGPTTIVDSLRASGWNLKRRTP